MSNALPLFESPSPPPADDYSRPLRRNSDPATSHEAARFAVEHLGDWQARALEAVRGCPGGTASEIAASVGHQSNHVLSRRLPELERLGLVVRGAARECRITGRSAAIWTLA